MSEAGFLYAIRTPSNHIKVGRTNSLPRRFAAYRTILGPSMEILDVEYVANAKDAERRLRKILHAFNIPGKARELYDAPGHFVVQALREIACSPREM